MGSVSIATEIRAPIGRVWDLLCDVRRYPEWDAFADQIISPSETTLRQGSTYQERANKNISHWRVTVFEQPHRQVHVGQVNFLGEVRAEVTLQATSAGTELRHLISYNVMPGLFRPIGWLVEKLYFDRFVGSSIAKTHTGGKRLLEEAEARSNVDAKVPTEAEVVPTSKPGTPKPGASAGARPATKPSASDKQALAPVKAKATEPAVSRGDTEASPDDLTKIKGIGPGLKKKLNDLGISTFGQIAAFTPADIERVNQALAFPGRIERDKWVEQAKMFADGG